MVQIRLKRVYEDYDKSDGYRVLVDRLWPRGVKKEDLHCDLWAKDISPSTELRKWYHQDMPNRWKDFVAYYKKELDQSDAVDKFVEQIKDYKTATLLFASKETTQNHAMVLKEFIENKLKK